MREARATKAPLPTKFSLTCWPPALKAGYLDACMVSICICAGCYARHLLRYKFVLTRKYKEWFLPYYMWMTQGA